MSDELIKSLERQLEKANAEAARHRSAKKQAVEELVTLRKEQGTLREQIQSLSAERDGYKAKTEAAPSALAQELDRLRGELRTRDHKEVFARLAQQAGVRSEAVNDLWSLSGYKAEADQADEATLNQLIADAKTKRGYLFAGETPTPSPGGTPQQPTRPLQGPGGGRGEPDTSSRRVQFRESELRQGLSGERQKAYLDAFKAGALEVID